VKLIARNNEVAALKRTNAAGHAVFEAGFGVRARWPCAGVLAHCTDPKATTPFLNLKGRL